MRNTADIRPCSVSRSIAMRKQERLSTPSHSRYIGLGVVKTDICSACEGCESEPLCEIFRMLVKVRRDRFSCTVCTCSQIIILDIPEMRIKPIMNQTPTMVASAPKLRLPPEKPSMSDRHSLDEWIHGIFSLLSAEIRTAPICSASYLFGHYR
jgi:hypothetical protein